MIKSTNLSPNKHPVTGNANKQFNAFTIGRKQLAAFDYLCRELEVRNWLEDVIQVQFKPEEDLGKLLANGEILCKLANKIQPNVIKMIFTTPERENTNMFKMMENVNKFLAVCASQFKVPKEDLFEAMDVVKQNNMVKVVNCLQVLAKRVALDRNFTPRIKTYQRAISENTLTDAVGKLNRLPSQQIATLKKNPKMLERIPSTRDNLKGRKSKLIIGSLDSTEQKKLPTISNVSQKSLLFEKSGSGHTTLTSNKRATLPVGSKSLPEFQPDPVVTSPERKSLPIVQEEEQPADGLINLLDIPCVVDESEKDEEEEDDEDWETDPDVTGPPMFNAQRLSSNAPTKHYYSPKTIKQKMNSTNHTVVVNLLDMPLMSNYWNISGNDLVVRSEEKLGEGTFAECYKGLLWGKPVAVKVLKQQLVDDELLTDFCQEVNMLSMLRHPNIVLFMGAVIDADHLMIVTEYCSLGSLHDILYKGEELDYQKKVRVALDASLGLLYLHKMRIIHGDIKPRNFLLDEFWNVKVADFGLARLKGEFSLVEYGLGTPQYMAPEQFEGRSITEESDVYSFGICLWELYMQQEPWPDYTDTFAIGAVLVRGERPAIPADMPEWYGNLIQKCWAHQNTRRPTMDEVVKTIQANKEITK